MENVENFYQLHPRQEYENSHAKRLDFLIYDLALNEIESSSIADFCGGLGLMFERMPQDKKNSFLLFDSANIANKPSDNYFRFKCDMNTYWHEKFPEICPWFKQVDYSCCFEGLEHLSNPYLALVAIKALTKLNGTIFISIPEIGTQHNVPYPGLMYPSENFDEFLGQMALGIERKVLHNVCFSQYVYTLRNLPWTESKMKWFKSGEKFRGKMPLESINA